MTHRGGGLPSVLFTPLGVLVCQDLSNKGGVLAKTSMIVKAAREPKFSTRTQNRCQRCGRPHSVYRKFGLCRVCFRELASRGELPGVRKASW